VAVRRHIAERNVFYLLMRMVGNLMFRDESVFLVD
jgi:hypothetical protein